MKLSVRAILTVLWATAQVASGAPRAEHVFVISIDGGKPAVIEKSEMPVLKRLAAEGACTWNAQTIFPSSTLPSHTSMLTGVGPAKHRVLWNSRDPKRGVVDVPTVFTQAKAAGLSTAMFAGKEKFRHLAQPGTVDKFEYSSQTSSEVVKTSPDGVAEKSKTVASGLVAKAAARYIVEQKPNLCFIHFTDPDDAGHKYGWGSAQQIQAFAAVDAALGQVLKAIDEADIRCNSVVIISADHGGHERTHGWSIPEDMTIPWIAWGAGVTSGITLKGAVVTYDTAATALWLLDLPLPASFDGKPVAEAFGLHAKQNQPQPASPGTPGS